MKLLNSHKETIKTIAVENVLKPRRDKLSITENELAVRGYEELYPEIIRKKMDALPAEFFNQKSNIFVYLGGDRRELRMKSSRRISARDNEWRRPNWETGADLTEVKEYFTALKQLEIDTKNLTKEIELLLFGITTVAKLQEVWPDGSEYYKWLVENKPIKNPLMVRPDKVNELILSFGETL